jgi:hypothetical protein
MAAILVTQNAALHWSCPDGLDDPLHPDQKGSRTVLVNLGFTSPSGASSETGPGIQAQFAR